MQNSKIEWTHHTFNPWWGCQRVSPGCEHCYAETLANRYGHAVWGPAKTTPRRMMSANYWKQPLKWHKAAQAAGERQRVFCASMADVFEDHPDLREPRARLFDLISETPSLDWLLLTKRPENVMQMLVDAGRGFQDLPPWVWLGTSVEDQRRANERIPLLLDIPARVRFLSCEPLLGPVILRDEWRYPMYAKDDPRYFHLGGRGVDWVIVGGESGHGARPMSADWARSLRDQCQAAGVAFHFKQWGEHTPYYEAIDPKTGRLETREYPGGTVKRVGKHAAGRLLDGREWNELPQ